MKYPIHNVQSIVDVLHSLNNDVILQEGDVEREGRRKVRRTRIVQLDRMGCDIVK
jgi:hypothetical protein